MLAKIDLLEKLAELRGAGVLSEDEYQHQKRNLLEGPDQPAPASPAAAQPAPDEPVYAGHGYAAGEPADEDESEGGRLLPIIGAVVGMAAAAFFIIPGSPGTRLIAELQWRAMSTPELEQEYMRAEIGALGALMGCMQGEGLQGAGQCTRLGAIVDDAIAMGDILCGRDAASAKCESARKLKETKESMTALTGALDEMGEQMEGLTSYEPR